MLTLTCCDTDGATSPSENLILLAYRQNDRDGDGRCQAVTQTELLLPQKI